MSVLNSQYAWLAVAGVVNSALSMGYYGWIIKRMYMDDPDSDTTIKEPTSMVIIFGVLIALTVTDGCFSRSFHILFAEYDVRNRRSLEAYCIDVAPSSWFLAHARNNLESSSYCKVSKLFQSLFRFRILQMC